ncbi:universal stress protein [Aurantibacter sp.]|uniref:universal stress protein n=1 Tax=Aurantibacter sp. TaxID=2807103 RepID=UPI003262D820
MKNILLPTDFSENAESAISYAIQLFKNEICTFYILHAYTFAPSSSYTKITAAEDLNKTVKLLKENSDNKNHSFESIMVMDSLLSIINKTIINYEIDFVIMGTRGSSAIKEVFFGSNTLDIIRYVYNCPVIAIPPNYKGEELKEIVIATDLKHSFKALELTPLKTITKINNATLNIARIKSNAVVTTEQQANKESLRNSLKDTTHQFFEVDPQGSVSSTLIKLEKENSNIGLIALLKTTHGFFNNLTREAVIKNMVYKTKIPLLILPKFE